MNGLNWGLILCPVECSPLCMIPRVLMQIQIVLKLLQPLPSQPHQTDPSQHSNLMTTKLTFLLKQSPQVCSNFERMELPLRAAGSKCLPSPQTCSGYRPDTLSLQMADGTAEHPRQNVSLQNRHEEAGAGGPGKGPSLGDVCNEREDFKIRQSN